MHDKFSPPTMETERLWSPNEVAHYLHVSRSWVYQKAEAGLLPVIRMPGSSLLRFDPEKVRAFARGELAPAKVVPLPAIRRRATLAPDRGEPHG